MHDHYYLVCLVFLVSVVVIDADSTLTAPKNTFKSALQPQKSTFQANKIDITVARLLRALKAPDNGHQEERAGGLSYYEKLKSLFNFSKRTPKNLKQWLKEEKSVDIVFNKLHLDKSEYFLFDRPHFAAWVEYA
ncbi:RxLR effector protein, partial [Phytophthora megakarya]